MGLNIMVRKKRESNKAGKDKKTKKSPVMRRRYLRFIYDDSPEAQPPIHSPHDRFIKASLKNRQTCLELLEEHLPTAMFNLCDVKRFETVNTTHIDPRLSARYTDTLFKIPYKDASGELYCFLLYEHQSTPDPDMPCRDWGYKIDITDEYRRITGAKDVPYIHTIVIYNGESHYEGPTQLAEMVTDKVPRALAQAMFAGFSLVNLSKDTEASTRERVHYGLMKLALRNFFVADLHETFKQMRVSLTRVNETGGFAQVQMVVAYLLQNSKRRYTREDLLEVVDDLIMPVKEIVMTSYDYIIEEGVQIGREEGVQIGREEGREEGVQIGVSNVAVQMLREGMPLTVVQKLTQLPLNVLEKLSKTLSSSES